MFKSARLKLTAWYLLIIMVISVTFSLVIYQTQTAEIERFAAAQRVRIMRQFLGGYLAPSLIQPPSGPVLLDPDLITESKSRLALVLIFINGGIFLLAGGVGYLLAGRTLAPIKDMMDDQNRFISDSSHELRTPLTSLKSAMEVYLRDKNSTLKDARELVSDGLGEVNKLQSLSDGLLQLAQYQKPATTAQFTKLSLTAVVDESVHKVSPLAKQKKISLKNATTDCQIEGNKYSLVDLLVILLDNAIKYSHEKGEITLSSQKADGAVTISILDHGIGIAAKDLPHIFDRFYRADTARKKDGAGGYGLGLSIAKQIATAHHGSLTVDSKLGKTTTFTFRFPVKQSA